MMSGIMAIMIIPPQDGILVARSLLHIKRVKKRVRAGHRSYFVAYVDVLMVGIILVDLL